MRVNEPVTNNERDYDESQKIVSTTDAKGIITEVNADFVDISGFSNEELIGQAHNLVRHPSMPQDAFSELWEHNKSYKPWMGMVKNRCKNGDHYWVDAFVTPIVENGQVIGFQSVRQKPQRDHVERAEKVYSQQQGMTERLIHAWQSRPMSMRLFVLYFVLTLLPLLSVLGGLPVYMAIVATGVLQLFASRFVAKPWEDFAQKTKSYFDSHWARKIYTNRNDELGQLQLTLHFLQSQKETVLYRVSGVSEKVKYSSSDAHDESRKTSSEIDKLYQEVSLAVTSTEQMSEAIQEVAANAASTSSSADESRSNVDKGQKILTNTRKAIDDLVKAVEHSAGITEQLSHNSAKIGTVVEVISGIAEQTNLLALNAAIEAARAGEQGRGFAVVADEVRALAGKTQESTAQIGEIISNLQQDSSNAVTSMNHSHEQVNASVENIQQLQEQFSTILQNVDNINQMCIQIASVTEEQSAVAGELSGNISNINIVGENTLQSMKSVTQANEKLSHTAEYMQDMVNQFAK